MGSDSREVYFIDSIWLFLDTSEVHVDSGNEMLYRHISIYYLY